MASYKDIQGLNIPAVATDPANPLEGELWYNTTANKFRGYGLYQVNAAWSTAPSGVNSGRRACAGCGTVDDGLAFAGYIGGFPRFNGTESYNGSSWSTEPSMPTPLGQSVTHIGTGSQAAGVGGYHFSGPASFVASYNSQWNGSSWSSASSLPASRYGLGGVGNGSDDYHVSGGAFANGGYFPQTTSWSWNGSAWSSEPAVTWSPGTAAEYSSWGNSTSDWYATTNPAKTTVWVYNGTSWATDPATFPASNDSRTIWGSPTSATSVGGNPSNLTATDTWNGTTWSASPATSNNNHQEAMTSRSISSSTNGWVFAGGPGNGVSQGETFVGPVSSVAKVDLDFS